MIKKIAGLVLLAGLISNLGAMNFDRNYDTRQNVYLKPYKPFHKKQKRIKRTTYYHTNNPNIVIMVKDSKRVSKKDIRRALRQYLSQNRYTYRYWR